MTFFTSQTLLKKPYLHFSSKGLLFVPLFSIYIFSLFFLMVTHLFMLASTLFIYLTQYPLLLVSLFQWLNLSIVQSYSVFCMVCNCPDSWAHLQSVPRCPTYPNIPSRTHIYTDENNHSNMSALSGSNMCFKGAVSPDIRLYFRG